MKTSIFTLLVPLFFINATLSAQIWYDENATWYRFINDGFTGSKSIVKVNIEKDTFINNIQVKKLTAYFKRRQGITGELNEGFGYNSYEYEQNDSIFHWDGEQFNLVYNFNLLVGDTVAYDMYGEEPTKLVLDSIITQNFSNHPRRVQYFRRLPFSNANMEWCRLPEAYIIIEGIGSLISRNPIYDFFCATDLPWVNLRCFSDSFIDYNPDNLICDSIDELVPTLGIITDLDLQLYPNPARNWLYIESPNQPINSIVIYDLLGNKISKITNQQPLNIQFLPKGIYFVAIDLEKQNIIKKIIKN